MTTIMRVDDPATTMLLPVYGLRDTFDNAP
jgi:hypothetical protein